MRPTGNGIYTGVSREDYERIDRMNWSTLKHMKRSPAHLRAMMLDRIQEDTDALRVGRAVHVATLEPERFRSSYAVWDGERRAGKVWDAFCAKNQGVEVLREKDYRQVMAIAEAARNNEHAAKYLRGGAAEVTMLWTHAEPANGVPGFEVQCKGRLDFAASAGAIVDLKTTKDAEPEAFGRQCWNLDYAAQAAFYVDGHAASHGGELLPYVIVAVEKEPPYVVQLFTVPEEILEQGRQTYRRHLRRLDECRRENRWPGYADGPLELSLPWWATSKDEEDTSGLGLDFEGEASGAT